jgi:hypothetical protein
VRARDFDDGTRGEKVLECLKDGARRLHHAAP